MEKVSIGPATLYRGDCLEVMEGMAEGAASMIWTDPPYGNRNNDGDLNASLAAKAGRQAAAIANDDAASMRRVVEGMLAHAVRILPEEASAICLCTAGGGGPNGPLFAWAAERMDSHGLSFFHCVIWDKVNPGLGWRYRRQHEMVMVAHKKGGRLLWRDPKRAIGNVISLSAPKTRVHPNEKPLALVRTFLDLHAPAGSVILDPFMGSGTTGVAALQLGLGFIGIELDAAHFDVACSRIEEAMSQGDMFRAHEKTRPSQTGFDFPPNDEGPD